MFVSDWMTKKVFTVAPRDSISTAIKLIKDKGIKHIPVLSGRKLKGIVSDRDIKEYIPSKATSLDVYELNYLLQKTRVMDVMHAKVFTCSPDTPVEVASMLMHDRNIGCLPVVVDGDLVGIISDRDIFEVLVDITGVRHGGHRIALTVKDSLGSIKDVTDIIRKHGYSLLGLLSSYEGVRDGKRKIVIRTKGKGDFKSLKAEMEGTFKGVAIRKG